MAHTFESVLDFFGDKAQRVGGAIVVNVDGKNVEVGVLDNTSGVFTLHAAGQALVEEGHGAKKARAKPDAKAVPDLGLDIKVD